MSAAQEEEGSVERRLERLRLLVLDRLIDILENGVPVQKPDPKTGSVAEIGRAPAPPAYVSAAIRFLKEQGAASSEGAQEELAAILAEASEFDDDCDDEENENIV